MSAQAFPTDPRQQPAFIHKARLDIIQKIAAASRKVNRVPDGTTEPGRSLYPRLDALLTSLDELVNITPDLRKTTKIDEALRLIYANDNFHFPDEYKTRAQALYEKWSAANWGGAPPPPPVEDISSASEDEGVGAKPLVKVRRTSTAQDKNSEPTQIKHPPSDHPIWGIDGIMHGLAFKTNLRTGRKSKVLNHEYEKRNAKVFGHNQNTPGTWYPNQLSALFNGAHGSSQAGITGDPILGAYSIVVSGQYDDLDHDRGETLYYSGSGSHNNTDPGRAAESTSGTRSLDASMASGKPVRVLRSSDGRGRYTPFKGIRYDGLYRVVKKRYPRNGRGGMYEQFELERVEGQPSLDSCRARPNGKDLNDYERIENGYPSRQRAERSSKLSEKV